MNDIKMFAKDEKELESLLITIRMYSQDLGMEFGIEKSAILITEKKKSETTKGKELRNQIRIRTLGGKEN